MYVPVSEKNAHIEELVTMQNDLLNKLADIKKGEKLVCRQADIGG